MNQKIIDRAVGAVKAALETAVANLNDDDYLEVLEDLTSDFESRIDAKRDELSSDDVSGGK